MFQLQSQVQQLDYFGHETKSDKANSSTMGFSWYHDMVRGRNDIERETHS